MSTNPPGLRLAPATHDSEGDGVDLVIPLRAAQGNEQLRYALRSYAANLPHGRIWVVGGKPSWLRNVHHIPARQGTSKYRNTTAAMRAACQHPDVSDPFIFCNDDFYVMAPTRFLGIYHRGLVADLDRYLATKYGRGPYLCGLRDTRKLLAQLGISDPLCYEVHVPMAIRKTAMLETIDIGKHIPVLHKRTLYGNLHEVGATRLRDPKVLTRGRFPTGTRYLSTTPNSFANGEVGRHIRSAFPRPSAYETPEPRRRTSQPARRQPASASTRRRR